MSEYVTSLVPLKEQKERAANGEVVKRFRYQSFTDRVSRVNVDIFHKIRTVDLAPKVETAGMKRSTADNAELFASFFVQRLPTQSASDKSAEFTAFQRDIRKYAISLPLLLHFREKIMNAFVKHLQVPSKLAIASLTDLLPHLARDLRHEFFPYFGRILDALVNSIDEKNPEIMEQVFSCIAYLFKFLIRSMVDNLETLFTHHYIHLLSHKKAFIRNFAAETLPFVIRRVHPTLLRKTLSMFLAYPPHLQMHFDSITSTEEKVDEDETSNVNTEIKKVVERVKKDGIQSVVDSYHQNTSYVFEVSENVKAIVWDEYRISNMVDGVGKLMYHLCRGVQGDVHSTCAGTMKLLFRLSSVHSDLIVEKTYKYEKTTEREMLHKQMEFRGRVYVSFLHDMSTYLKSQNTEVLSSNLTVRAHQVLLRIHEGLKIDALVKGGKNEESSDSSSSEDSDSDDQKKMGDMEIYGHNETKVFLNAKTLSFVRVANTSVGTVTEYMRELIHLIAAFEEYVHLRGPDSYLAVTHFITDLTNIDFLRALPNDEVSQLLMFHIINLYLLTLSVCNDLVSPKSTRVITEDKRAELMQAIDILQLILRDVFTLPKHYFLFTYMINVLRIYMSSSDVSSTILPVLLQNVIVPTLTKTGLDIVERNEVLHLLHCLTRPIPKHILSAYPRIKPLSLTFTLQDMIREIPHLQAQFNDKTNVPQHMKPIFYKQYAASLEIQEQLMGVYDVDINTNTLAHVIMKDVSMKHQASLVNYLANVLVDNTNTLYTSEDSNNQVLIDSSCVLHILLGMFVSPFTSVEIGSKKKAKSTNLYSVYYTLHTVLTGKLHALLQAPSQNAEMVDFIVQLAHFLYTVETVCVSTSYARLTEGMKYEDVQLEVLINKLDSSFMMNEYKKTVSVDILSVLPVCTKNSVGHFLATMFQNMAYMFHTLNTYQQNQVLSHAMNHVLFALYTSTLQRLSMFVQECSRHIDTGDQNEVQRLLLRSDAWTPEKSVLNNEVVDTTRKSSLLEEDNMIEDSILAEEHMRYLKRSKKLWNEYQKSLLPADQQKDKHMRDRPKVDKTTFLSEVEKLKVEKKEKANQEHEDNITRIFVSHEMTHKERRNIIGDVLKKLRQDRLQSRRDANSKETELELDLKQKYLEANVVSPFLAQMQSFQTSLFPVSTKAHPSAFQIALTKLVLPYLSSSITSVRCLAITCLTGFSELPFLNTPITTQQEQEGTLLIEYDGSQVDGREGNILNIVYMISCLPAEISTNRSVLKRLDSLQAYAGNGIIPLYYVHILMPFLVSVFSMRMTNYFGPAQKVMESLLHKYPTHAWPYMKTFLFDSLLHNHTISNISTFPALYGGIMPSEPSHDLMTSTKTAISTVSICNGTYNNSNLLSYLQTRQYSKDLYIDFTSGIKETSMKELFTTLTTENCKTIATKQMDDIFDLFIFFMRTEFTLFYPLIETATWKYDKYSGNVSFTTLDKAETLNTNKTHSSAKLVLFLRIFNTNVSKIHNYKHANNVLVPLVTRLLSFTDNSIQLMAFNLLVKLKLPYILPYTTLLERMFDFKELRTALTTLTTSIYTSTKQDEELVGESTVTPILPDHRAHLAPLLYYMFMRSLHDSKAKFAHSYRTGIVSALSVVPVQELVGFFTLLFRPFLHMLLHSSGNAEYSTQVNMLEETHLQNVMAPFQFIVGKPIPSKGNKITLMSSSMLSYVNSSVYHDSCMSFCSSMVHECALDSIVSHLVIANNQSLLVNQPIKSSMDHFIGNFQRAVKHDLRDSFPLLLNNTQFALQEYFQIPIKFAKIQFSALTVLSSKSILPYVETSLAKQVFFLNMLQDVIMKLRTSAVPYLPSIMQIVCYLLQRVDLRLKQHYENSSIVIAEEEELNTKITVTKKFSLNRVTVEEEEEEAELSESEEEKEEDVAPIAEEVEVMEDVDAETKDSLQQLRLIRKMCLKFVADMVDFFWEPFSLKVEEVSVSKNSTDAEWFRSTEASIMSLSFDKKSDMCVRVVPSILYESLHTVLLSCKDHIKFLPQEGVYSRGSLLEVVCTISRHRALQSIFALPEHADILPSVFSMLNRPDIEQKAANAVLEIALHLINTLVQLKAEENSADMNEDSMKDQDDEDEDADEDMEDTHLQTEFTDDEDAESTDYDELSDDDDSGMLSEKRRQKLEQLKQERTTDRVNSLKFDLSHKEVTPVEQGVVCPALSVILSKLLACYTPVLLQGLSTRMQVLTGVYGKEADLSTKKKKNTMKRYLPKREFFIASYLSEFITDAITAQNLISMLILYLPEDQPRPPYSLDVSALSEAAKTVVDADPRVLQVLNIFIHAVRVLKSVDFLLEMYTALSWELLLIFDIESRKCLVDVLVEIQKQVLVIDHAKSSLVLPEDLTFVIESLVALEYNRKMLATDVDFTKRATAYNLLRSQNMEEYNKRISAQDSQYLDDNTEIMQPTLTQLPTLEEMNTEIKIDHDITDVVMDVQCDVSERLFRQYNDKQLIPFVAIALHELYSKDFAVREQAISALTDFIHNNIGSQDRDSNTPSELVNHIHSHILRNISNVKFHIVRKYHLLVLRALGQRFPEAYESYNKLASNVLDNDFFVNIMHVQPFKRTLALRTVVNFVRAEISNADNINYVTTSSIPQYKSVHNSSVNSVLLPLIFAFLTEVSSNVLRDSMKAASIKKHTKRNVSSANEAGIDHALLEECIRACSVFIQLLPWKVYTYRILQMFKNVTNKKNQNKFFLRAACVSIEAFPFKLGMNSSILAATAADFTNIVREQIIQDDGTNRKTGHMQENMSDIMGIYNTAKDDTYSAYIDAFESTDSKVSEAAMKKLLKNKNMTRDLIETLTSKKKELEGDCAHITDSVKMTIRKHISTKILPNMFRFATDLKMEESSTKAQQQQAAVSVTKNIGSIRVGVVMALVHLLQKVSVVDFHIQFPRLLRVVCTQLGRKEGEYRISARKTLVEILHSVGPEFFIYILRELKSSLTNGYQIHVLGNALHLCLNTYIKEMKVPVGSIDSCLPVLLPLLREDLLGAHVEEKSVELLCSRYSEVKSVTAPTSFELLGMNIEFSQSVPSVTGILAKDLGMNADGKLPDVATVHRITHCLHKLVRGLNMNSSIKQDMLLTYVLDIMRACTGVSRDSVKASVDESSSDDSSESEDDTSDSDVAWYNKLDEKKKKNKIVYTGELKNNFSSKSRVVGGKLVGGSVVNAKRITDDERLSIHPSLGGTTHRSKQLVKKELLKTIDLNLGRDFLLSISKNGQSNYQGGSALLLYSLELLSSALNSKKYSNISAFLNMKSTDSVSEDDAVILSILADLPRLLNMSIFQIDKGHKEARKELGNTCGGKGADSIKGEIKRFQARTEQVLNSSLRIQCILLRLPLNSWVYKDGKFLYGITNFVLNMLVSSGTTHTSKNSTNLGSGNALMERFSTTGSTNIRNICFKVLSYGLKYNPTFKFTDKQLHILIPIINYEIRDKVIRNVSVFAVLFALLDQQVMVPEIFDIATYCSELLLRSNEDNIRNHASNIFFHYLLTYPLAPKRQEQHLSFLLNNINYEIPGSRAIIIKLLQHVVAKFPFAYIEKYAELIFFPVCLSLYNDTDPVCKEKLTSLVGSLFNRLNGGSAMFMNKKDHTAQLEKHAEAMLIKRNTLLASIFTWMESKQPAQIRMACLILGAITPYIGSILDDYCEKLVAVLGKLIKGGAMFMVKQSEEMTQAIIYAKRTLRGYDEEDKYNEEDDTNTDSVQNTIFKQLLASQQDMEAEVKLRLNSNEDVKESFNEEDQNDEELINITADVDKLYGEESSRGVVIEEIEEDEDQEEAMTDASVDEDAEEDHEEDQEVETRATEKLRVSSTKNVKVVTKGVNANLEEVKDEELFRVSNTAQGSWYIAYTALCCLEKVWKVCPSSMLAAIKKYKVWGDIIQLCLHPHNWVRLACSRMLYTHFQQCDIRQFNNMEYITTNTVFTSMEELFDTAKTVALQTNSTFMDEAMSKFMVHNLSFVTLALYMASEHEFFKQYNAHVKAKMLEHKDEHSKLEFSLTEDYINGAMHWVISNVGFLSRKTNNIVISLTVFAYFQELIDTLPALHLKPFLLTFVDPLYRITEDPRKVAKAYKILGGNNNFMQKNVDKLKEAANATSEKIKKKCGAETFVQVYHTVHRRLTEVRSERKRKLMDFANNDPLAYKEKKRQKVQKDVKRRKEIKNFALSFRK